MIEYRLDKYRPYVEGEKLQVAFLFQAGTVWASWESVYDAFVNDDRFNVRIILLTQTTVETSHNKDAEDYLKNIGLDFEMAEDINFDEYIPHAVFIQFPYDAAFHTPDMLSLRFRNRGSRVIYIPYGIEISDTPMARKDHFNSRVIENSWRIYVSAEGIKAEYDKYCRNREAVRVTGSPKFDCVRNKEKYPLPQCIKEKAASRKIVILKLHFPKVNIIDGVRCMITPYLSEYKLFAEQLSNYRNYFFIILPHPKMVGKMVASDIQGDNLLVDESLELMRLLDVNENVYIDTTSDYRYSLYNASAIIMDRSGLMLEAAMLDVPLLLMENSDYKEAYTRPVDEVMNTVAKGATCNDMCTFLDELSLNKDYSNADTKEALNEWFPLSDGLSGKRIRDDVYASICNECNHTIPKIVVYGTGEISSYYFTRQKWSDANSFEIVAISDSDSKKWGQDYFGYKILPPEEICKLSFDYIVIMTEAHFYEIQESLIYNCFIDDRKILRLDEFVTVILDNKC